MGSFNALLPEESATSLQQIYEDPELANEKGQGKLISNDLWKKYVALSNGEEVE